MASEDARRILQLSPHGLQVRDRARDALGDLNQTHLTEYEEVMGPYA